MVAYGALNAGYAGYPPRSEPSPNSSRNPGNYGNNNYNRYGAGWDGNYGAARTSVPPPSNGGPSYPSASSGQAYPPASSGQGYPPASSASGYPPASSSSYPGPSSSSGYPPNYYGGNQGKWMMLNTNLIFAFLSLHSLSFSYKYYNRMIDLDRLNAIPIP